MNPLQALVLAIVCTAAGVMFGASGAKKDIQQSIDALGGFYTAEGVYECKVKP